MFHSLLTSILEKADKIMNHRSDTLGRQRLTTALHSDSPDNSDTNLRNREAANRRPRRGNWRSGIRAAMTITTEANSDVVSLAAYRSRRRHTRDKPISSECWENAGTDRLWWLGDGRFLAVLTTITWGPFIWTLHSLTTAP